MHRHQHGRQHGEFTPSPLSFRSSPRNIGTTSSCSSRGNTNEEPYVLADPELREHITLRRFMNKQQKRSSNKLVVSPPIMKDQHGSTSTSGGISNKAQQSSSTGGYVPHTSRENQQIDISSISSASSGGQRRHAYDNSILSDTTTNTSASAENNGGGNKKQPLPVTPTTKAINKRTKLVIQNAEEVVHTLASELTTFTTENAQLRRSVRALESHNAKLMRENEELRAQSQAYLQLLDKRTADFTRQLICLRFIVSSTTSPSMDQHWDTLLNFAAKMNLEQFENYVNNELGNPQEPSRRRAEASALAECMTECLRALCVAKAEEDMVTTTTTSMSKQATSTSSTPPSDPFLQAVKLCLSLGASPTARSDGEDKTSALLLASGLMPGDDVELLEMLFAACTSPEAVDHPVWSSSGGEPAALQGNDKTLLMEAAMYGKTNRVAFLLRKNADFTLVDSHNRTALDLCSPSLFPATRLVLTQGMDLFQAAMFRWMILVQEHKHELAFTVQKMCLQEIKMGRARITDEVLCWLCFSMAQTGTQLPDKQYLLSERVATDALSVLQEGDDGIMVLFASRARARLGMLHFDSAVRDLVEIDNTLQDSRHEIVIMVRILCELIRVMKNPYFVLFGNGSLSAPSSSTASVTGRLSVRELKHKYHCEARRTHPDKQKRLVVGEGDGTNDGSGVIRAGVEFAMISEAYTSLSNAFKEAANTAVDARTSNGDQVAIAFPLGPISSELASIITPSSSSSSSDHHQGSGVCMNDVIQFIDTWLVGFIADNVPDDWTFVDMMEGHQQE